MQMDQAAIEFIGKDMDSFLNEINNIEFDFWANVRTGEIAKWVYSFIPKKFIHTQKETDMFCCFFSQRLIAYWGLDIDED